MVVARVASFLGVTVVAAVLAFVTVGNDGLTAVGVGVVVGGALSFVSSLFAGAARRKSASSHLFMVAGVTASFGLLIVAMMLLYVLAPQFLRPASLTALALYLTYKSFDVYMITKKEFGRSSLNAPERSNNLEGSQ